MRLFDTPPSSVASGGVVAVVVEAPRRCAIRDSVREQRAVITWAGQLRQLSEAGGGGYYSGNDHGEQRPFLCDFGFLAGAA